MDYFSGERNLFTKVKIIVSSFFGFLLCASTFRFPMQKQKNQTPLLEEQPPVPLISISGLKALISSQEQSIEDRVIRSVGVGIIRSNLLTHYYSSSSSSFCSNIRSCNFLMDDLIGTESGVCLTSNSEELQHKSPHSDFDCRHYRTHRHGFTVQNQRCVAKKQIPPPIPFLAVQARHRPRSPWILTRHCSNRRLILKLERVTQHQSLESRRENGRLILNLVPIDDDDDRQDLQYFIEEEEGNGSIECEDEGTDSEEIAFKSFTYGGEGGGGGGGIMFCGVNDNFEERHVVHGHFGSAPLRPMGTVM